MTSLDRAVALSLQRGSMEETPPASTAKKSLAPATSKRLEKELRLNRTLELYTLGYTETQISKILKSEFKIKIEVIRDDLEAARNAFAERSAVKREVLKGLYNDMLMDLYQKAYQSNHYKTCVDIVSNLAKINKLYEPDSNDRVVANITYTKATE